MIESLFVKSRPVPYGAAYCSGMDQVEFLGVEPVVFGIVDFKGAVWGDPVRGESLVLVPFLRTMRKRSRGMLDNQ